jgi:putative intracellular protease/amidase
MKLKGKRVAMLVADFYQPLEFWYPYYRLKEEGAEVKVVCRGESHMTRFGKPMLSMLRHAPPVSCMYPRGCLTWKVETRLGARITYSMSCEAFYVM